MKWISVRFSPEAKHFWKWLHTWLGVAAAGGSIAYEHLDVLQDYVSPGLLHNVVLPVLIGSMVYNSMRAKK